MTAVSNHQKDWESFYDKVGQTKNVGIGTLDHQLYSTKAYQRKKKKKLLIGGISRIVYAGFENDPTPTILTLAFESQYNTILALNVRYMPKNVRYAILQFILKVNKVRIRDKKSLVMDYKTIVAAFPLVKNVIRRYKIALIGVRENVPMIGWKSVIDEQSQFARVYRRGPPKR